MEGSRIPRKPFVGEVNKHLWMNLIRYLMQYVVFLFDATDVLKYRNVILALTTRLL